MDGFVHPGVRIGCQTDKEVEMRRLWMFLVVQVSGFDTCGVRLTNADRPKANSAGGETGVNRLETNWLKYWHAY